MRIFLIMLSVLYCAGAGLARSVMIESTPCPTPQIHASAEAGGATNENAALWRDVSGDAELPMVVKTAEKPRKNESFSWIRAITEIGETIWRRQLTCDE